MGDKDEKNKGERAPTSGESQLWRTVMRDVTPIAQNSPEATPPVDASHINPAAPRKPRKRITPDPQAATPAPQQPAAAQRPRPESGIDKRTLDRLRLGKMPLEAVLDLHGMRQHEAHQRLRTFILSSWMSGKRALLVITGKGTRSPEPGGVLRKQVPIWLHDDPLGEKVLTIQTAQPKDGGSGAFYVLLRRNRG